MKYFLDTEFLEGSQKNFFGKTKPTIDLISIGIVSEDNREYYAISKDFNLKEAWNRYDLSYEIVDAGRDKQYVKKYWIRDNVLRHIFIELTVREANENNDMGYTNIFNYVNLKRLIKKYGKSNKEIAEDVFQFVTNDVLTIEKAKYYNIECKDLEFYTYYGAYDWVVFCWLFGRMIDLPKGFPMYSRDLKQMLDEKVSNMKGKAILHYLKDKNIYDFDGNMRISKIHAKKEVNFDKMTFEQKLKFIKTEIHKYPKQQNEHNALDDAKWNKELYNFLNKF